MDKLENWITWGLLAALIYYQQQPAAPATTDGGGGGGGVLSFGCDGTMSDGTMTGWGLTDALVAAGHTVTPSLQGLGCGSCSESL